MGALLAALMGNLMRAESTVACRFLRGPRFALKAMDLRITRAGIIGEEIAF